MKLSPFVLLQDPEKKDAILILDTASSAIGQVWMFRTNEEMQAFVQQNEGKPKAEMMEYRILILHQGFLNRYHGTDVTATLMGMAFFYERYFIIPNAPRYKKYRISPPA